MTKKEFVKIAEAIASIEDEKQRREVAVKIGKVCYSTNPRFDVLKFYTACGCKKPTVQRPRWRTVYKGTVPVREVLQNRGSISFCSCTGEGHKESCSMFCKEEGLKQG